MQVPLILQLWLMIEKPQLLITYQYLSVPSLDDVLILKSSRHVDAPAQRICFSIGLVSSLALRENPAYLLSSATGLCSDIAVVSQIEVVLGWHHLAFGLRDQHILSIECLLFMLSRKGVVFKILRMPSFEYLKAYSSSA